MNMLSDRRIVVLYGSQTGTAQDTAERIWRKLKCFHFQAKVMCLDNFPMVDMLKQKIIVFICSTTGQGDPPDNMNLFWKFILRKNLPLNSLNQLQYAVLGLGDSSYQKFNFVAKLLFKRLKQLGATPLLPLGLADDQHDLGADAVIDPWLEKFSSILLQLSPIPKGTEIIPDTFLPPPKYKVVMVEKLMSMTDNNSTNEVVSSYSQACPFKAKLLSNFRVTPDDHWQDVRCIRLDINNSNITYNPGDIVFMQPANIPEQVDHFFEVTKFDPNQLFYLEKNDPEIYLPNLPEPCSIHYLVENYLDINAIPRRYFFNLLSHFTSDELEKEKFIEFTTAEGQEELYSYCNRPKRHIIEVLADFVHVNIPFDYIFDLIPALQPRAFSISSSLKIHADELQLLISVVKYKTIMKKERQGVCSTWISRLNPIARKEYISIWVKQGTIIFPHNDKIPVIMIGPGTGCAPFRCFIQDRCSRNVGGNVLFYGCRNHDKDYFFQEEWNEFSNRGLLKVITAFSRDQNEIIYVQHRISENSLFIWQLIHIQGAHFYIAGNAKQMPDAVRDALKGIVKKHGNRSLEEAENYILQMEKCQRYQTETWS